MIRLARSLPRLCLLGVAIAALGLSACGRKGPLELPPATSSAQAPAPQVNAAPLDDDGLPVFNNVPTDPASQQRRPGASKKRIFLDPLID